MAALWPGRGGPAVGYISAPPPGALADPLPRRVALLGATGSIGRNALAVVEASAGRLQVTGLACARNVERLARQALRHRPPVLAVLDDAAAAALRPLLPLRGGLALGEQLDDPGRRQYHAFLKLAETADLLQGSQDDKAVKSAVRP